MSEKAVAEQESRPQEEDPNDTEVGGSPKQQLQGIMVDTEMNAIPNKEETTIPEYTALFTLQGHKRSVSSLSISPDGQQLASSGVDGLLKIWSMATGALIATLDAALATLSEASEDQERDRATLKSGLCDVAWSKDGRYLVSGGDDCLVRVWDAEKVRFFYLFSFFFLFFAHPL